MTKIIIGMTFLILGLTSTNACFAQDKQTKDACINLTFDQLHRTSTNCEALIALHDISAKIETLHKGNVIFTNPKNKKHQITCEQDVKAVTVEGTSAGIQKINDREKRVAKSFQCTKNHAYVWRTIEGVSTTAFFVSLATHELVYGQSAGGSCHGRYTLTTFKTSSGEPIILADIINDNSEHALAEALADDFITRYGKDQEGKSRPPGELQTLKEQVLNFLIQKGFSTLGVFAQKGEVWVNIGTFMFSCAEGNLFPVKVPNSFIVKDTNFYEGLQNQIHSRDEATSPKGDTP